MKHQLPGVDPPGNEVGRGVARNGNPPLHIAVLEQYIIAGTREVPAFPQSAQQVSVLGIDLGQFAAFVRVPLGSHGDFRNRIGHFITRRIIRMHSLVDESHE